MIGVVLLITYDLHKPQRDYADVEASIRSFGDAVHAEESVWLVDTLLSPSICRDALRDATDREATVFVTPLRPGWSSYALDRKITTWLKDPTRRWGG